LAKRHPFLHSTFWFDKFPASLWEYSSRQGDRHTKKKENDTKDCSSVDGREPSDKESHVAGSLKDKGAEGIAVGSALTPNAIWARLGMPFHTRGNDRFAIGDNAFVAIVHLGRPMITGLANKEFCNGHAERAPPFTWIWACGGQRSIDKMQFNVSTHGSSLLLRPGRVKRDAGSMQWIVSVFVSNSSGNWIRSRQLDSSLQIVVSSLNKEIHYYSLYVLVSLSSSQRSKMQVPDKGC